MENKNMNINTYENTDDDYEISIIDIFVVLVKQRFLIAKITFAFTVAAIVYSLIATPVYKSTLQIIPPDINSKSGTAVMLAAASGLGDLVGGIGSTQGDTIVGITKSTVVLDRVIDKNNLLNRKTEGFYLIGAIKGLFNSSDENPSPKMRTKVRESLSSQIQSSADSKSGIITVSVSDHSPEMATNLAQSVFDETLGVMQNIAVTPAAKQRLFIEEQLKENNKALSPNFSNNRYYIYLSLFRYHI